jgi:hypothetical protein
LRILAPPLAAFTGVALAELQSRWKEGRLPRFGPPIALFAVAVWQTYLFVAQAGFKADGALGWIWLASTGVLAFSAIALLNLPPKGPLHWAAAAGAVCTLFVMPILGVASVVLARPNTAAPVADIAALVGTQANPQDAPRDARRDATRQKLINFLIANRASAKYLVAVPNAVVAAPLIVATGMPVMAMGGYLGDDPILDPPWLQRLVADGQVRFVMLGGFTLAPDKQAVLAPIEQWVRTNGRPVDDRLWLATAPRRDQPFRIRLGSTSVEVARPELFDLSLVLSIDKDVTGIEH